MSTTADPRVVARLLRLYPAGWRERYADEFAAVLVVAMADGRGLRRRLRVAVDVAAGAVDAHLHPGGETAAPARPDRIRNAACLAFCAFAVFCVAGTGLQKMSEDPAFAAAARAHAVVGWSYGVIVYGAIAAALAVVAGSLPVLLAIAGRALGGRLDLLRLLLVPPLTAAVWVGLVFGVSRVFHHGGVHSTFNVVAFLGIVVAGGVVAAASAAALVSVTRRVELPAAVKQAAWVPMTVLSAAMVAVTTANLVWGLSLPPDLYHSRDGVLATPLAPSWIGTLALMAAATSVAVAATVRAVRLARRSQPPAEAIALTA